MVGVAAQVVIHPQIIGMQQASPEKTDLDTDYKPNVLGLAFCQP